MNETKTAVMVVAGRMLAARYDAHMREHGRTSASLAEQLWAERRDSNAIRAVEDAFALKTAFDHRWRKS